ESTYGKQNILFSDEKPETHAHAQERVRALLSIYSTHSGSNIKTQETHDVKQPYICQYPECRLRFDSMYNLTAHKYVHAKEKRIHDNEKSFKCTHTGCESHFGKSSHLIIHERIHTGEKPFKCTYDD